MNGIRKLGETYVTTVDGTYGTKGFVTDIMMKRTLILMCLYSCGPVPMLKALEEIFQIKKHFYH